VTVRYQKSPSFLLESFWLTKYYLKVCSCYFYFLAIRSTLLAPETARLIKVNPKNLNAKGGVIRQLFKGIHGSLEQWQMEWKIRKVIGEH
jgi:hypothetical protein